MSWSAVLAKWINEVGDEIFFFGASLDDFFFVFYYNLVVGDFGDFMAGNGEGGVNETLD